MKQTVRITLASLLLVGLFAAGQRNEVAADKADDDLQAQACEWGRVVCPDNGWSYTYTYGGGCWNTCGEAEFATPPAALHYCNNYCDSACVNTGDEGECS